MKQRESAIIIGGGLGGLFTGAFLAKNGLRVTVLEKNPVIGGGLQCFMRNGKIFETGMHIMGGFEEGGTLSKLCNYLGILDELSIHHVPSGCMDEIHFPGTNKTYKIPSGKQRYIERLSKYFPEESDGIRRYVEAIFSLTEELPLFNMRPVPDGLNFHTDAFLQPADKLISHYVKNPELRNILAYLNPLYGGKKGHTPAFLHALINVLFIKGASRFIGGSQQLADALQRVIESHGGHVSPSSEVSRIEVIEGHAKNIETTSGEKYKADWVISTIHPSVIAGCLPKGALRKGFVNRLNTIPNSCSAFSLYIDLKPDSFRYIDHSCFYIEEMENMWNQDEQNTGNDIRAFMYMTPPGEGQGEFAGRLFVYALMSFEEVRKWENTSVGKRCKEYEEWKRGCEESILSKLESIYPNLRNCILHTYTSSPLTIRDFYHTKEGAIFGYRKDCDNILESHVNTRTRISNLLLAGQNVNMHGICGVPLNAVHTAEIILGRNNLIRQINEAYENR